MTIVLIGETTGKAWYQLEEIADAIDHQRKEDPDHRVAPVLMIGRDGRPPEVPYGLRRLHSLRIRSARDRAKVAREIVDLVRPPPHPNVHALATSSAGRWGEVLDQVLGFAETLPRPDASFSPAEAVAWEQAVGSWSDSLQELLDAVRDLASEVADERMRRDLRQAVDGLRSRLKAYQHPGLVDLAPDTPGEHCKAVGEGLDVLASNLRRISN